MKPRYKTSKKQNSRFGRYVNKTHKFNVTKPKFVMRGGTRM